MRSDGQRDFLDHFEGWEEVAFEVSRSFQVHAECWFDWTRTDRFSFFFHIAINHPLQVETSNSLSDLLLFDSSREWATALSLKNRMRWEGLHPDVITWNTLLSATSRWESILRPLVMLWVRFMRQFVLHLGRNQNQEARVVIVLTCCDQDLRYSKNR